MTDSLKTFSDLFSYAKSQARIEFVNYAGGRDSVYYWRQDKSRRDSDRKKVMVRYGWLADRALPIGRSGNGRLMVTADIVEYCAGQYPPTEVWGAVFDYLQINYK